MDGGFHRFHADSAPLIHQGVHAWLEALRGHTPQSHIARRSGRSRHQIRRWLSGESEPRVPDFLCLIHALTGRAQNWVAAFVDMESVPALLGIWRAARAAARLAYDAPWSSAVRVVIGTEAYRKHGSDDWLCHSLGLAPGALNNAIEALLEAGLAERRGSLLVPISTFTVDASASDADRLRLKIHWARVAADRAGRGHPGDLTSVNLVTLSEADLERVRELQRAYFRELRSLVAASEPEQTAALVVMQVLPFA